MSRVLLLLSAVAVLAACNFGTKIGPEDGGVGDAGPTTISCGGPEDCPQDSPECSFGVCKRPCAANDGCVNPATFCNQTSGYCEAGCRDSSTCGDGTVCSAGACIASQGCGSNCDCAVGQVCANNACQDPPAQCNGPNDCPKGPTTCAQFSCNGFTHQCFDEHPTPCNADNDCVGRLGCAGGCTCVTDTHTCSTNVQCTVDNELTTCGAGFYCGAGTCQAAPACTAEGDCTASGLTCNLGTQQCERSRPCTSSAQCTAAPNLFCDVAAGRCAQPLCTNGGATCQAGQSCSADGRCVTQGTGGPCSGDTQCQANEYCALVNGVGSCAIGCRNNGSCGANQQCNGSHTCTGGGGGGLAGWQQTCSSDGDCQAGLFCGGFTHICQEACDTTTQSNCATDGCCPLSGAACCTNVLVDICSTSGC